MLLTFGLFRVYLYQRTVFDKVFSGSFLRSFERLAQLSPSAVRRIFGAPSPFRRSCDHHWRSV